MIAPKRRFPILGRNQRDDKILFIDNELFILTYLIVYAYNYFIYTNSLYVFSIILSMLSGPDPKNKIGLTENIRKRSYSK